jgi:hypothetical protein
MWHGLFLRGKAGAAGWQGCLGVGLQVQLGRLGQERSSRAKLQVGRRCIWCGAGRMLQLGRVG